VEATAEVPSLTDFLARKEEPPEPYIRSSYRETRERTRHIRTGVNYLQMESRNQSLGRAGEIFVVGYERARLERVGKFNLADRVQHVAAVGDGEGFDVRSFETNGTDRLIEVKTTAYGKQTPFFLSRNELEVSRLRSVAFHLYRLFNFRSDPRFFSLKGALDDNCLLEPVQYSARTK
jgi:hypothetical protein